MIRPIEIDDRPEVMKLAEASGLFKPNELEAVGEVLDACLTGENGPDQHWIAFDQGELLAVAYYAPEQMSDRVWNLFFIAVRPDQKGKGLGKQIIQYVEESLAGRGERLLIVETSGLASFEDTRAFYRSCGFEQAGSIRDYYGPGDAKVIFIKDIAS